MSENATASVDSTAMLGVGRLGAVSPMEYGVEMAKGAQIDMIERRILRIEMALRRAGIEVEQIALSDDPR